MGNRESPREPVSPGQGPAALTGCRLRASFFPYHCEPNKVARR